MSVTTEDFSQDRSRSPLPSAADIIMLIALLSSDRSTEPVREMSCRVMSVPARKTARVFPPRVTACSAPAPNHTSFPSADHASPALSGDNKWAGVAANVAGREQFL